MRILLQNSLFWPNLAGGAERVVHELALGLSERGHTVDVLTTSGRRGSDRRRLAVRQVAGLSGRVYEGPSVGLYDLIPAADAEPPGLLAKAVHHGLNVRSGLWRNLSREVLDRTGAEILHTHNLVGMTPSVWRAGRDQNVPLVHTIHDLHLLCPRTTLLRSSGAICEKRPLPCRALGRSKLAASRHVDVVTAPSRHHLERHLRVGAFRRARPEVVPNGRKLPGTTETVRPEDAPLRGIYLGALDVHKGVEVLLAALQLVRADTAVPALDFALAGAGPLQARVQEFCATSAGRYRYLGTVSGPDKEAALAASDFLVVPSTCLEAFSLAALDGLGHGLPVIGANRGGIPEVVTHGVEGQIIEPVPDDLAGAMTRYLSDSALLRRHAAAARRRAEAFTLDRQVDRFEEIYRELAADSR